MFNTALIFVGFCLGRFSYFVIRDTYLELKREELIKMREELKRIADSLEKKDAAMRKKWQSMVNDFSQYNSYALKQSGEYENKWSDWDDQYLKSWISAEK